MNWRIHSGLSVLFITLLLTWFVASVSTYLANTLEPPSRPDDGWVNVAVERFDSADSTEERRRLVEGLAGLIESNLKTEKAGNALDKQFALLTWGIAAGQLVSLVLIAWGTRGGRYSRAE